MADPLHHHVDRRDGTGVASEPAPSFWLDQLERVRAEASALHRTREKSSSYTQAHLPTQCDVVVIGCGLTGAALAHYLSDGASTDRHATRTPLSVVVLEARTVAGGATGRNGGILWPDSSDPFEVGGAQLLRDFVETNAVPCGLNPTGGVSLVGDPLIVRQGDGVQHRGTPDDPDVLDGLTAIDPAATLGAAPGAFSEGWLDAQVASLWPARVALALAERAAMAGVRIIEGCAVTEVVSDSADDVENPSDGASAAEGGCGSAGGITGGLASLTTADGDDIQYTMTTRTTKPSHPTRVLLRTSMGELRCRRVIVATNGWMPRLIPELAPHFRSCTNTVLASEPLPQSVRWPVAVVCCGGGASEVYCSQAEDGTMVCGGLRDCNVDGLWAGDDDGGPGDAATAAALERWCVAAVVD